MIISSDHFGELKSMAQLIGRGNSYINERTDFFISGIVKEAIMEAINDSDDNIVSIKFIMMTFPQLNFSLKEVIKDKYPNLLDTFEKLLPLT